MAEAPRQGNYYRWCSDFPIGCLTSTEATIPLNNLPAGTNTLSFTVAQRAGSSFGLDFAGQVSASTVAISKTSESFLLRTVGSTSPTQRVTLTNIGSDPLNITGIKLTGTNPGDFAKGSNCGSSVAPGKSCTIGVTFTPTAEGDRTALVSIADSAVGSPQTITLEGRGTFFGRIPWSMNFGNQPVGTPSATQTTIVTNVGPTAMAIYSIGIGGANPGDFTQANNCGASLKPGDTCTVTVTFHPHHGRTSQWVSGGARQRF